MPPVFPRRTAGPATRAGAREKNAGHFAYDFGMSTASVTAVTALLQRASDGDTAAEEQLYRRVYPELRRMAHGIRKARPGETLDTTALVHEAYMKVAAGRPVAWQQRAHFFGVAARAMRQVLVDAARRRMAGKRLGDGAVAISFDDAIAVPAQPDELVALDEALARLATVDARRARVVELRFFAGLTTEEIGTLLEVSVATVERDWRAARAWLAAALDDDRP